MFKWAVLLEDAKCCVSHCDVGARHVWAQDFPRGAEVAYCCRHFTAVISEIFDARDAIYARSTQNALMELEKRVRSIITLHKRMDEETLRINKVLNGVDE
jgi:hypothetical protein